jgi:transaldolase
MTTSVNDLKIKLFADGADLQGMLEMAAKPFIQGLTTNPTLMRKAGIEDYRKFAHDVLFQITDKPISFEVFSDDLEEMKRQGVEIASWGQNVYVKIPITTTSGDSTSPVVEFLVNRGVKVNVTALMTQDQVIHITKVLNPETPSYVSVFAGRIADTGRNPVPIMEECVAILAAEPNWELIWASPRELLNVFQANEVGCHIITATNDILKKLDLVGYDLASYSLDTVKMFRNDALAAAFSL